MQKIKPTCGGTKHNITDRAPLQKTTLNFIERKTRYNKEGVRGEFVRMFHAPEEAPADEFIAQVKDALKEQIFKRREMRRLRPSSDVVDTTMSQQKQKQLFLLKSIESQETEHQQNC